MESCVRERDAVRGDEEVGALPLGLFGASTGAAAALVAAAIGIAVWLPSGPLAKGWAAKAGTPASLIGGKHTTTARSTRQ